MIKNILFLFVILLCIFFSCKKIDLSKENLAGEWRMKYVIEGKDTFYSYTDKIYSSTDAEYIRYSLQKFKLPIERFVLSPDSFYFNKDGFHLIYPTNIPPRYNFYKFFGNQSVYKVWDDSIAFYNLIFQNWDKYKIVLLHENEMQLQTQNKKLLCFDKIRKYKEVKPDTLFDEIVISDLGIFISINQKGEVWVDEGVYNNNYKSYKYQLSDKEWQSLKMKFAYIRLGKKDFNRKQPCSHCYLRYTILKNGKMIESSASYNFYDDAPAQVIQEIMQKNLISVENKKSFPFELGYFIKETSTNRIIDIFPTESFIIIQELEQATQKNKIPESYKKWPYFFENNVYSDGSNFYFEKEKVLFELNENLIERLGFSNMFLNDEYLSPYKH